MYYRHFVCLGFIECYLGCNVVVLVCTALLVAYSRGKGLYSNENYEHLCNQILVALLNLVFLLQEHMLSNCIMFSNLDIWRIVSCVTPVSGSKGALYCTSNFGVHAKVVRLRISIAMKITSSGRRRECNNIRWQLVSLRARGSGQ